MRLQQAVEEVFRYGCKQVTEEVVNAWTTVENALDYRGRAAL